MIFVFVLPAASATEAALEAVQTPHHIPTTTLTSSLVNQALGQNESTPIMTVLTESVANPSNIPSAPNDARKVCPTLIEIPIRTFHCGRSYFRALVILTMPSSIFSRPG
jgi:hypothetical protein